MIVDLDTRRELIRAKAELARWQQHALHLLVAPWSGGREFAITAACVDLGHPRKFADHAYCVCGRITYEAPDA